MIASFAGLRPGSLQTCIDVRGFIQKNYTPYDGDESFLSGPSEKTRSLWSKCEKLLRDELSKGVLKIDTETVLES
jgi:formate C-acetyltransferase